MAYPSFVEISDYCTQLFFNTVTEIKSVHYIEIIKLIHIETLRVCSYDIT